MKQLISIILLIPFFTLSQNEWKEVASEDFIRAIQEFENSIVVDESYSMVTTYKVYQDYSDATPVQTSSGRLICRNGNELNLYQMGFTIIQDKEINVTIDTMNQQIVVQNPDSSFFYRKTINDVSEFSEMAKKVHKKEFQTKTTYSLELKEGYPYNSIEIEFEGGNRVSEIIIYSNQPYKTEDQPSNDKAKVVISINEFKKGKTVNLKNFKTPIEFVLMKDNIFQAVGKYKDFEVIDLRN